MPTPSYKAHAMKTIKYLSVALSISLGANLWFTHQWYLEKNETSVPAPSQDSSSKQKHVARQEISLVTPSASSITKDPSASLTFTQADKDSASQQEYLNWLQALAHANEFQKLEFEVRAYLRIYPQDITATLLEAQAYYHNKPLNVALVHYHQLLSQPLSAQQHNEVNKLIVVNTTRIIQQFSGDGAWDMLAEFLEPLVQIDPRNRQYLMALATAYGMQSQFTLMEDVLANFTSDDVRAIRLRNSIVARLEQSATSNANTNVPINISEPLITESRQADLLLQQQRGQFVTRALVQNTYADLLVDTGASTTALSESKFNQINNSEVEFLGLFKVNTAGGSIEAPIYKVNRIVLGELSLTNTSVIVIPSENLGRYDGLLGMNVLSQFDLSYDAATETMRLYKKR